MEDWQPFGMNMKDYGAYEIKHRNGSIMLLPGIKEMSDAVVL
jgi:hypothetical protein